MVGTHEKAPLGSLGRSMVLPDNSIELASGGIVAGVDEAGRGPWAGPVVAAAVVIRDYAEWSPKHPLFGLNDSKQLSILRREKLFDVITTHYTYSVSSVSPEVIDRMNILQATLMAMRQAIEGLPMMPDVALIDGNKVPQGMPCRTSAIVQGDARSISIAAASVVAKVTRDRLMQQLHQAFPGYGWDKNAGYGVKAHQEGLRQWGVTPHHRRSFAPIKKILEEQMADG